MSKPKNNLKKSQYIGSINENATFVAALDKKVSFNFSFFIYGDGYGQSFQDWEKDGILASLNDKLKEFSQKSVRELKEENILKDYTSFPRNSGFQCPPALSEHAEVLRWARFQITGKRRLVGFLKSGYKDNSASIFYVVFLDKDHQFYPSKLKHT